ncbi:alpha/beta hydrolase [Streptomyces iconiensis]
MTATAGWAAPHSSADRHAPSAPAALAAPTGPTAEERGVALAAQRAGEKGIDWKACPQEWSQPRDVRCGTVTVPVDYAEPGGDTIDLAVNRFPSQGTEEQRQGSLFLNPGGPGGSGMAAVMTVGRNWAVWKNVIAAYDLVGFDPRGVGHSAPVSCVDPQQHARAPKPDPVPRTEADRQRAHESARAYARGCRARSGAHLPHVNTPDTARDMDVIRAALGEKKLSYLGMSYGTYLGAVYGTLFPRHVRRMALDSVVNPSNVWYENHRTQVRAFERRFGEWLEWIARHDDTFHLGSTAAGVRERWEKLLAESRREPLGGRVGPYELTELFMMTMYSNSAWVPRATAWSEYEAGRPQSLVEAARPTMEENGTAAYTAVNCNDAPWPKDLARWDRDAERLHERAPLVAWFSQRMSLPCASWPEKHGGPVDVRTREGLPPVLIVQNEGDAATPLEGATELHRRFEGSRVITVQGEGQHIATQLVNPCVNRRVDAYLLHGTVDDADVTCDRVAPPEPGRAGGA